MPSGLRRVQESGQSHFITFSCDRRQPLFSTSDLFDEFVRTIEDMRRRFQMRMYGYVVMPEHVHLLVSEPPDAALAEAIHYLKLSFAKRARGARPPARKRIVLAKALLRPECEKLPRVHGETAIPAP